MRKLMLRVFSYFSHSLADMFLALVLFIYILLQDSVIKRSADCCLDIYSDTMISSGSWVYE